MNTDYVDACAQLGDEVDQAVNRAMENGLSVDEVVEELRMIAQGWKDSQ